MGDPPPLGTIATGMSLACHSYLHATLHAVMRKNDVLTCFSFTYSRSITEPHVNTW